MGESILLYLTSESEEASLPERGWMNKSGGSSGDSRDEIILGNEQLLNDLNGYVDDFDQTDKLGREFDYDSSDGDRLSRYTGVAASSSKSHGGQQT